MRRSTHPGSLPVTKYQEEEDARDRVVQAAMAVVDSWEGRPTPDLFDEENLVSAVHALRSLHADQPPPKEES